MSQVVGRLLAAEPFSAFEVRCGEEGYLVAEARLASLVDEDLSTLAVFNPADERTTFINLSLVQRIQVRGRRLDF